MGEVIEFRWLLSYIDSLQRCPKDLLQWWKKYLHAALGTTERIFQIDFPTWVAYRISQNASCRSGHFSGQAELKEKLSWLEAQNQEKKREVATRLSCCLSQETREKIGKWEQSMQSNKRQRTDEADARESTLAAATTTADVAPPLTHNSSNSPSTALSLDDENNHLVFLQASLDASRNLFLRRLYTSIVRSPRLDGTVATSVNMISPSFSESVDSQSVYEMRIELQPVRVPNIAKDLFGANLEINNGVVSVQADLYSIEPHPSLVLKGCRRSVLPEFLGDEVSFAVTNNCTDRTDKSYGFDTTSKVTMEIFQDANYPAILSICLGLYEGFHISEKL